MRWFKHMTGSHRDESLCRMMDHFGLEGYGAYWVVLEAIAAQCDGTDRTHLTLSVKNWRKIIPFAPQKLTKWLAFAAQLTLFCVEITENLVTVSCPKLLKYRDEYSERRAKKSGVCRDNIPPDTDTDTEADTEIKETPLSPLAGGDVSLGSFDPPGEPEKQPEPEPTPAKKKRRAPTEFSPELQALWVMCPEPMRECGRLAVLNVWETLKKNGRLPEQETIVRALGRYIEKLQRLADPKWAHLRTWLDQGRWDTGEDIEVEKDQGRRNEALERQQRENEERERAQGIEKWWSDQWAKVSEEVKEKWRSHVCEKNDILAQAKERGQDVLVEMGARGAWRRFQEAKQREKEGSADCAQCPGKV